MRPSCPSPSFRSLLLCLAGLCLGLGALPGQASAQQNWDDARVRELVGRARLARSAVVVDDSMRSYQADARGYVYFFLDRAGSEETNLVKTDQIALEVFWKAPDSTRQRIVGLRDEATLPTNINYHLDHLTVVQDDYDNLIRIGDGDEVSSVVHPVAPGSDRVYEFRIADSLTISFPGPREPVRVYEVEVRPRDFSRPGFVGTVFIDRASAAIVRMNFTFTSASYVDEYLDYIRISLDNSLWDGQFWLPYEQRVELRREVPWFDFPAGSVIRGRYEIRNYRFNEPLPAFLFQGSTVTALPRANREAFPFEEGLHEQVDREGLGPSPSLEEVRAQAARIAGQQLVGGLRRQRVWVPQTSFAARRNRAEGSTLGAGAAWRASDRLTIRAGGGYAFGARHPYATVRSQWTSGSVATPWTWSLDAHLHQDRDLGPFPLASGVGNSIAGILGDSDYRDLYFATGARLSLRPSDSPWEATLALEQHESATSLSFGRPLLPITEGTLASGTLAFDDQLPGRAGQAGFRLGAEVTLGRFDPTDATGPSRQRGNQTFGSASGSLSWTRTSWESGFDAQASLRGGWSSSSAPAQTRTLLGGRGTLVGYPLRTFVGDRWMLYHVEGFRDLAVPWVRVGAFGSIGATWLRPDALPAGWTGSETGLARWTAGLSARWLWDILRTDVGRGLNGGEWQLHLSIHKRFWPWL